MKELLNRLRETIEEDEIQFVVQTKEGPSYNEIFPNKQGGYTHSLTFGPEIKISPNMLKKGVEKEDIIDYLTKKFGKNIKIH